MVLFTLVANETFLLQITIKCLLSYYLTICHHSTFLCNYHIALAMSQLKNHQDEAEYKIFQKKVSEKRTTSLQVTNGPSPMCPLFGGFTVYVF